MMKHVWWLGFMALVACSRSGDPEGTDSSTHWLDACRKDADCGAAWECICGVCAAPCETRSPCQDIANNRAGVCSTLSCDGHQEVELCTAACSDEQPCPKSLDCQDGVCVPDGARSAEPLGSEADASGSADMSTFDAGDSTTGSMASSNDSPSNQSTASPGASNLDSSSDAIAPPTVNEFAAAFLEATCQFMINCDSTDDDQQRRRLALVDVESCKQSVQWSPLQRDLRARVEATRAGLFSYDASLGELAIARVQGGCNLLDDAFQRLDFDDLGPEVFDGNVELEGACNADVECRGDAYCERPIGHCMGSCQPRPQLGQECSGDPPCGHTADQWPLACDDTGTVAVCSPTVVISDLTEGEACSIFGTLGGGAEFRMCGPNLFCSRDQEGVCKPLLKPGEQCFSQFDVCEGEATCRVDNPEDPEASYVCRTFNVELTAGAACDESTTLCSPFAGLACDEGTRECFQQTDGSLGSPCNAALSLCVDDLYCDSSGATSQCRMRLPIGAECSSGSACESGRCADEGAGTAVCSPRYCANEP